MVKTDYKADDYITWGRGENVRFIAGCVINKDYLDWSETIDEPNIYLHAWELKDLRLATDEEIIAAGFKVKSKTIEIW